MTALTLADSLPTTNQSQSSAWLDSGLVPSIIDAAPLHKLNIHFSSGVDVDLGNELTPTQVKDKPEVSWPVDEDNKSWYTLLMIDPDAPSRVEPTYAQVFHWCIVNVPGNNVTAGQIVADYMSSGPPPDTDLHRYTFLIFKQAFNIITDQFIASNSRLGRTHFDARQFITKFSLGQPVAGNFYIAAYDDYVPIRNAGIVDW
ncbi:uncharacterized protein Dwil_GK11696 [Drosophila willistoni]|uniref:Phosphatidylethanolamine-binding protein n=2 Tax=Drosophila willistoni TaxID=7260 RepID=B4NAE0_DROWI|nr:uncharacterized protein Dwil_GK11696 [Drosophila willistoni]